MGLIIEVKYPLNNLTTQGKNSNDCVVCTENTNDLIIYLNQPVRQMFKGYKKTPAR